MLKRVVFFVLLSVVLAACGTNFGSVVNEDREGKRNAAIGHSATNPLRLGYLLNMTHAVPIVGIESGRFADLQPMHFLAGGALIDALITRNVDLGYFGPGPFINAISKDIDLVLLAGLADGANSLVLAKDLSKVKHVGIPQYGNTQDLIARIVFEQLGLKPEFIAIAPPEMETAFFTGDIDAALVAEPWGTMLSAKPGLKVTSIVEYQGKKLDLNIYPATLLVVERGFYNKHKKQVDDFLAEQDQVLEHIKANPEQSLQLIKTHLAKVTKKPMTDEFARRSFATVRFNPYPDPKLMELYKQTAIKAKYIRNNPDLSKHYGERLLSKKPL